MNEDSDQLDEGHFIPHKEATSPDWHFATNKAAEAEYLKNDFFKAPG